MLPEAQRRIAIGLAVFVLIVLVGTSWYWLVEGFPFIDALYQTIITVSTVGFGEIQPLDDSGRLFTIVVVLLGVGAGFYAFSGLFEYVVGRQIGRLGRRRLERTMQKMTDHAVVCGYGRIGSKVAELIGKQMPVVIIDQDPKRQAEAHDDGLVTVLGDAGDEETLDEVHLDQAKILVAALPTDADNLYVVLTGRSLNPDLHIVSRAQHPGTGAKLLRAGADRIVNPEDIGAQRLAAFALRPTVSEFLDVVMHGSPIEYRLEEIAIGSRSTLVGSTLAAAQIRERTGATILAVKSPEGEMSTNPGAETVLAEGTKLIAFGTDDDLKVLAQEAKDRRLTS